MESKAKFRPGNGFRLLERRPIQNGFFAVWSYPEKRCLPAEFILNQLGEGARVSLAACFFHDLADEEIEGVLRWDCCGAPKKEALNLSVRSAAEGERNSLDRLVV